MKRKLCFTAFLMCILCLSKLNAQTTQTKTIGNGGGTSTVLPIKTNSANYVSQQIYTASDLGGIPAGAVITSMSLNVKSVPKDNKNATCNFSIYLKNTDSGSFANGGNFESVAAADKVASMNAKFTAGWVEFTFDNVFTYTGKNILVCLHGAGGANNMETVTFALNTNTTGNSAYSATNVTLANIGKTKFTSLVAGNNQIELTYVAPPTAPTNLNATATGTSSIALSWNGVAGATSYKVYQNGAEVATVTTYSYNAEGLTSGTNYCYTVKAVNSYSVESAASNEDCATTWLPQPPTAPTGLTATPGGESVALTWNAVTGATAYNIYNADGTVVAENVQGTSYVVTGLTVGVEYCFTVKAVNAYGESAASNSACATAQKVQKYRIRVSTSSHANYGYYLNINSYDLPNNASTVGVSAKSESNNQIFMLDDAGNGNKYIRNVDGYYIKCSTYEYVNVSNTEKTPLALQYTDQNNFYIRDYDKSATAFSNQNYFEVKNNLVDCWGISNGGNTVTWTLELVTTAPSAPVLAATATSYDRISLSWNAVNGAVKYNVYDANGIIAENITETSYVVTGLNPETNYCYTVTAVNDKGEESDKSKSACATTKAAPAFPAPTNLQATVTNGTTIGLTWDAVDGAVKYNIYIGANVVEATNPTYTFVANANTRYCFAVTAVDSEGTESAKTEDVCLATIPTAPGNLQATAGGKSVSLSWYSVGVAESYNIYNGDDFVANVQGTSYTVKDLTVGKEYCYTVTAVNAAGESGHSNEACATPTALSDVTVEIGNGDGGSGSYIPVYTAQPYSYSQQFYAKSEINAAAGDAVTSIAFRVAEKGMGTDMPIRKLRVYLSNIEDNSFEFELVGGVVPNYPLRNLTGLVFEGDVTFAEGWVKIEFTTPFQYTGNGILVTVMNDTGAVGGNNIILFTQHSTSPKYLSVYGYDSKKINPVESRTGTRQLYRNDIQFTFNSSVAFPTLPAPENLTATAANDTEIDLSWDPSHGATNYNIYYREEGTQDFKYLANVTGLSYRAKGLLMAHEYCFIVTGANGTVESPDSNVACATTEDTDGCTVVFTLTDASKVYPEYGMYGGWGECYLEVQWNADGSLVSKKITLVDATLGTTNLEIPSGSTIKITYNNKGTSGAYKNYGFTVAYQGSDDVLLAKSGTALIELTWNISIDCSLEFIHDGDWDVSSNWNQNRVPNEGEFVLISADAEINRDVTVKAMTINDAINKVGSITLNANNSLTVTGDFKNADANAFVIKDGAQVIQNNDDVMATFEMIVKAPVGELEEFNKTGWQFIASPMKNALTANFETEGVGYDLFKYDGDVATTEDLEWINYKGHDDFETEFQQGYGYMASYHTEDIAEFQGLLNYESTYRFSDHLKYHGDDSKAQIDNFYLLGNPFTFDMDWNKISATNLATGYAVITTDGNWSYATSGKIKAGDGFFVKVTAEDPILNYNVHVSNTRSVNFDNESNFINIIASSKTGKDNVIINFANDGEGFDKLENFNNSIAEIYVKENDRRYGILNYDENVEEVELYFNAHKMGEYTINAISNADYASVVLVDRLTGNETNLLDKSYTFKAMTNDNHDRFVLKLSNEVVEDESFVYRSGDELIIKAEGNVQVLDIMGRVVYNGTIVNDNHRIDVSAFNSAAYIIRVVNANEVKTQKVVIW